MRRREKRPGLEIRRVEARQEAKRREVKRGKQFLTDRWGGIGGKRRR